MYRQLLLALAAMFTFTFGAVAQEDPPQAQTTAQTDGEYMAKEELKLRLKPMRLAQVEVELEAWLAILESKTREIATNQIANNNAPAPTADDEAAQMAIVDRVEVVIDAYRKRGADSAKIETYEAYVASATGVEIDSGDIAGLVNYAKDWLVSPTGGIELALNIVFFLLTIIAFRILAGIAARIVRTAVSRMKKTSELLRDFFVTVTRQIINIIGLVVALSVLGIEVGPFVAAIGAVGFIVGFALQGTLANFAAGIMILVYRPYDVGEVVTVAGKTGKVDAMSLVSTTLRLFDNQVVIIPNGSIWGDVIQNATTEDTRRVDMKFGCGYDDDLKKVQSVLEDIINNHDKVLKDPAPVVKLHELGDSSVNFVVRPWSKTADYWDVFWDVTRTVKERFDAEGLSIPFPQRDVHMHEVKAD